MSKSSLEFNLSIVESMLQSSGESLDAYYSQLTSSSSVKDASFENRLKAEIEELERRRISLKLQLEKCKLQARMEPHRIVQKKDVYFTIREYFHCSSFDARVIGKKVTVYARKTGRGNEISYGDLCVNYGHVQRYAKHLLDDFCRTLKDIKFLKD